MIIVFVIFYIWMYVNPWKLLLNIFCFFTKNKEGKIPTADLE